ncbi:uncharacterized protein LOC124772937 [Schistocerca piceifrons]|uniref:uncharacterized protein LOC124772937 n=1 Tax=Schistocerca piceifrons TaxID=274613 RepID=UPI001F5FD77D|nr:uncharacterized protein LOC124772937 [Schistocerca piceifrons]
MVAASKPMLELLASRDCRHIVHPWTPSCWRASLRVFTIFLFGSSRLMLPAYAAQVAVGGWRPSLASALRALLRSLCFGTSVTTGIFVFHCLFRYLLGGYRRSTALFWPAFLAGLSVYIEDDRRKPITAFYYYTWLLEWLFRRLSAPWPAVRSRASLTLLFTAASGALMWTLRRGDHPKDTPIFWFFRPSRRSGDIESNKGCSHQGTCWNHGLTLAAKYLAAGVALQAARHLLAQWRRPAGPGRGLAALLGRALCGDNSLGLFLAAYVALYQAVRCGLRRLRGEDRSAHALLAGVASGGAFWLHPDLTIAFAAVTTLVQLRVAHLCDRRLLEPVWALCLSALLHVAVLDRRHCPPGFMALTEILAPGVVLGIHKRLFYLE